MRKSYFVSTRKGLTLLETLVALALFLLAGAALIESCSNALNGIISVIELEDHGQTHRFAIRQVIRIADRDEFESGGEMETVDGAALSWKAEVEETSILDLFKVDLTLQHREQTEFGEGEEIEHNVTLYLLRPDWSNPIDRESLKQEKLEALISSRSTIR